MNASEYAIVSFGTMTPNGMYIYPRNIEDIVYDLTDTDMFRFNVNSKWLGLTKSALTYVEALAYLEELREHYNNFIREKETK